MKTIDVMKLAVIALEYHTYQTRPIQQTKETLAVLRKAIKREEDQQLQNRGEREALVTRESALAAIDYMDQSNTRGRSEDAADMIAAAEQKPNTLMLLLSRAMVRIKELETQQAPAVNADLLESLESLMCDHGGSRAVSPDDERAIKARAAIANATKEQS